MAEFDKKYEDVCLEIEVAHSAGRLKSPHTNAKAAYAASDFAAEGRLRSEKERLPVAEQVRLKNEPSPSNTA